MHYLHTHGIINTIPEIEEHLSNVQEAQTILYTSLQKINEDYKREGYPEGHQQGREEGIKKGLKAGITQGKQQGLVHGMTKERLDIAKKMSRNGIDDAIIKISKISPDELQTMKKKMNSDYTIWRKS